MEQNKISEKKAMLVEIDDLKQKYEITNHKLDLVLDMIANAQKHKSQIIIHREK